jgi:hypothetical protein
MSITYAKLNKVLKVEKLEHYIWDIGNKITHKSGVYTMPIEDNREA